MKKLVPWLKANLISVISVAVAIITAPIMMYFSSGWSTSVREGLATEVAGQMQKLDQLDVTYQINPYLSGQQPISVKATPNKATTEAVTALLTRVTEGAEKVRERAADLNGAGKALLIDGETTAERLFPDNPDVSARLRLLDRLIAEYPTAHDQLLTRFHAGSPTSQDRVKQLLSDLRAKEVSRRTVGRTENDLSEEDRASLDAMMGSSRLELYRNDARSTSFYANRSAFQAVQPWDTSKVLPIETAWEWQFNYWIHEEVIEAVAAANSDDLGSWLPVFRAPVKVIESIAIVQLEKPRAPGGRDADLGGGGGGAGAGGDGSTEIQRNFNLSHTGRAAAPTAPNPIYDIRYVDLTLIVSSQRLPAVLAAFSQTNFMTVIDVDLEPFDAWAALAQGYDLGSEHVVRARIRVETVWLRAWMKKWMPPSVRKSLGIPDDAPADKPAGQESAPASAPSDSTPEDQPPETPEDQSND